MTIKSEVILIITHLFKKIRYFSDGLIRINDWSISRWIFYQDERFNNE